ncbi:hypothetical protein H2198_004714 [Neophaeococcomyces mojaviensis]|uniref:Uncharacterized protein n=1 Tax=Neophaeococcomyces mojaviensis TaxID=3383035 RepID=A0ACC3A7V0_9EURO|nr:hypothetical protein H2198_004714 [Knufia sp. JES_112]
MDWNTALPFIAALTQDLTLTTETTRQQLIEAQQYIARAVLSGQDVNTFGFLSTSNISNPPRVRDPSTLNYLKPQSLPVTNAPNCLRRDFAIKSSVDPRVIYGIAAGQDPSITFGPFLDKFGRVIAIDVFEITTTFPVSFPNSDPYLYLTMQFEPPGTTSLASGGVWIPARQLVPSAPVNSFVGLKVLRGQLDAQPGPAAKLTLELAPVFIVEGSAASTTAPSKVCFLFRQSTGRATLVPGLSTGGAISIFGEQINLQHQQLAAVYEQGLGRVNFPMQCDRSKFGVRQGQFVLGMFQGEISVLNAAWSLPVVVWPKRNFSAPSGPGGFALSLDSGLLILPVGRDTEVSCGISVLIAEPGGIAIGGAVAVSPDKSSFINVGSQTRAASEDGIPVAAIKSTIAFRTPKQFSFRYIYQLDGNESWSYLPDVFASLDQPRDVNNSRIPFTSPSYTVFTRNKKANVTRCTVEASRALSDDHDLLSFAIRNLVFKTDRINDLYLTGECADNTLQTGVISLNTSLWYTLPILPDPYATNISFDPKMVMEYGSLGSLDFRLRWSRETSFDVDISFPPSFDVRRHINVEFSEDPKDLRSFNDILGSVENTYGMPLRDGAVLLDLSTNVSQFGISFNLQMEFVTSDISLIADQPQQVVSELALQCPLQNVRVFTLPSVQWEPITLLNQDGTLGPGSYEFSYSGPPTKLQSNSANLTPIAPREVIDQVVLNQSQTSSSELVTLFSLPFGTVAVVKALGYSNDVQKSPEVNNERPVFNPPILSAESDSVGVDMLLAGGDQISIKARIPSQTSANSIAPVTSPSLPGTAVPLYVNLNHSSNAKSVLGPIIPSVFQNSFRNMVPLTRIDISGYGESVFSNWNAVVPLTEAGISKVYFDVFSGRTSRELVEMTSVLCPYMARVVRTISIERASSGTVFRRDSGWQATSDGDYSIPGSDIKTHPGVVLGVSKVTNIRDVNPAAGDVVKFDCLMRLEDGEGFIDVPARDQLGFVVTGTNNTTLSATETTRRNVALPSARDYAWKLLDLPLGGAIDAVVNVGKSGMKTRITSVSVAPCRKDAQNPVQFAMAAWGSPVLPGEGQWSLAKTFMDGTVKAVDGLKGVPLIREGLNPKSIPLDTPYHFADPTDLLKLADPNDRAKAVRNTVYSVVHATDSHRLLFPDAALDQVKKGVKSLLPPVLADSFALGTSTGIFPKIANCIPLRKDLNIPDEAQLLQLVGGDNMLFNPGKISLDNLTRELQKDGNVASLIQTAGKLVDNVHIPSEVNVLVDTVKQVQNLDLKNISMVAQNEAKKEVNRVIGDIKSAVGKELTKFVNSNHIFGEALQEVKKVVSFLDTLGVLPPLKVSMTNEWALEISTGMGLKEFLEKIHDPATKALMTKFIQDFELAISARSTLSEAKFKLKMHLTIKVDSGFGLMAIGVAGFDLGLSTATGLSLSLELGVGIGITFTVGPFGASAYYSQSQTVMKSKDIWGVGATAVVKAHVDLVVATADLCLEAKLMLIGGTCHDHETETTIWAWAQVSIALDISIFWVVNVSVHESAEWKSCLKNGGCELEQMK